MIKTKPDNRTVNWFFDPVGGTGKSSLIKYLIVKGIGQLLGWGKSSDLFYARTKEPNKDLVLFDFSRSKPENVEYTDLFAAIESIKNGIGFSPKFYSQDFYKGMPFFLFLNKNEVVKYLCGLHV